MDLSGFDPSKVEDISFEPLPAGEYVAIISDAMQKQSKSGYPMLKLTVEILRGPGKGRKFFDHLLRDHEKDIVVQIADARLKQIFEALNLTRVQDSSGLLNKPLRIVLGQDVRSDTGELQNVIRGYKPVGESVAPVAKPADAPVATEYFADDETPF